MLWYTSIQMNINIVKSYFRPKKIMGYHITSSIKILSCFYLDIPFLRSV